MLETTRQNARLGKKDDSFHRKHTTLLYIILGFSRSWIPHRYMHWCITHVQHKQDKTHMMQRISPCVRKEGWIMGQGIGVLSSPPPALIDLWTWILSFLPYEPDALTAHLYIKYVGTNDYYNYSWNRRVLERSLRPSRFLIPPGPPPTVRTRRLVKQKGFSFP